MDRTACSSEGGRQSRVTGFLFPVTLFAILALCEAGDAL